MSFDFVQTFTQPLFAETSAFFFSSQEEERGASFLSIPFAFTAFIVGSAAAAMAKEEDKDGDDRNIRPFPSRLPTGDFLTKAVTVSAAAFVVLASASGGGSGQLASDIAILSIVLVSVVTFVTNFFVSVFVVRTNRCDLASALRVRDIIMGDGSEAPSTGALRVD